MNDRGLFCKYTMCVVLICSIVATLFGCANGINKTGNVQSEAAVKKQAQIHQTKQLSIDSKQPTVRIASPATADSKQPTVRIASPATADSKKPTVRTASPTTADSKQLTVRITSPTTADSVQTSTHPEIPTGRKVSSRHMTVSQRYTSIGVKPLKIKKVAQPIRGIYVTSYIANSSKLKQLVKLIDQTELNAMVLDINSGISLAAVANANTNKPSFVPSDKLAAKRYRQVIKELKKHNIYLIARITTFKDPVLARTVPAWTIKARNGEVWKDRGGSPWIDPYQSAAWDYTMDLAEYAAELGFDEIQYDYVRFPENETRVDSEVHYANNQGWSKSEAIRQFLHRASARSHQAGVKVSADVFGLVGSSSGDMGIGQTWNEIVKEVDVISPMIYPSHYSKGMWGIDNPDLSPGMIITHSLRDADLRNQKLNHKGSATATIRPWLQSFTASWVHPHQKYGLEQIQEQIQAARKVGIASYLLWNSSSRYPLFKE